MSTLFGDPSECPNDCPWLANESGDKPSKEWADKVNFWFGIGPKAADCEVTQKQINIVSTHTHMCWRQLGYALGFSYGDLFRFDEHSKSSLDKVQFMLYSWRDKFGREATLQKLLEACAKESVQKRGAIEADLPELYSDRGMSSPTVEVPSTHPRRKLFDICVII
eukprot:m.199776 g.199776  ORF g.199776 m.199776 type:complete len:165 (+) comp39574_c0_seq11:233-727(+)